MIAQQIHHEEFILPFHASGGITQHELSRIRQCSRLLRDHPKGNITIVAPRKSLWGNFVMNTLLHFDVPSYQIKIHYSDAGTQQIKLVIVSK